jgi:hypothetical protein
MTKNALLYFFILLSINTTQAQTPNVVKGRVVDYESKLPIPNASIEIIKGKKSIYKTYADSLGNFSISLSAFNTYTIIKISSLKYHSLETLSSNSKREKDLGIFQLSQRGIDLKEVVIKKNKRYQDTTIIDLSKETFDRSIMIDDLFSQKGLFKDSDGSLFYKGKPVSDVVVNGGVFFGKNNTKIYDKLPALTVNNIEIIETNIDSITNTTLLNSSIRVNLILKEKYNKGKFGSISLGTGTTKRYIFNTDLYGYRNQQQISFTTNVNNIDVNEIQMEPIISFSPTGNNASKENTKITYRNIIGKKLEIDFSGKGKTEKRFFVSEQQREDMTINQFSKLKNVSTSKTLKLEDLELNIRYVLDTLNTFQLKHVFNYDSFKNIDTINYHIQSNDSTIISDVNKNRHLYQNALKSSFVYEKRFSKKKGRLFQINIIAEQIDHSTNERSNILEKANYYMLLGKRYAHENKSTISMAFTEPMGEQGYLKFLASYKKETLDFSSFIIDTTAISPKTSDNLTSSYIQPGFVFQKTLDKTSLYGTISGIINSRSLNQHLQSSSPSFNVDCDVRISNRISKKKSLSWNYTAITNYPNIAQLTDIRNTFDLISQVRGNINLKPEIKHSSAISYDSRISDSLNILVIAEANRFYSKFGYNLNTEDDKPQISFIDNVGNSNAAQISISISKTFSHIGNFNFRFGFNYSESPTIVNAKSIFSKGSTFTQSISTTRSIIRGLSITPSVISTYNKYSYETGQQNLFTLVYADKIALNFWGIEMNHFPIINLSKGSLNNNITWAVNSEAKKNIFKGYGIIWVKAYDIFNSFKFQYNAFGSSYAQSIKYSNLQRYFLIGFSLKFNNMK